MNARLRLAPVALWATLVPLAVPVAWAAAHTGLGVAVREPLRDLALLLLWSAAEEVVFRGGLQPLLQRQAALGDPARRRFGLSPANLITSIVFAAAHLWAHPPLAALAVFPVSLLLGASLERSGRLAVPVLLHAWFNACLYAASWSLARA